MAPKKKGNKDAQEDWEAELGETITPAGQQPTNDANGADDAAEGEDGASGRGGLMAMLRKGKEKRKKKGLPEDEPAEEPEEPASAPQAAQDANIDDEFALPDKKEKGGKGKQQAGRKTEPAEETGEGGRVLTKAEKEKLKKEREKQRKKEQVRSSHTLVVGLPHSET